MIENKTKIDDDGNELEWCESMKAWVPNITDEFIYLHNMNYGFVNNIQPDKAEEKIEPSKELPAWLERLRKDFQDECQEFVKSGNLLPEADYLDRWNKFYTSNFKKYEKEQQRIEKENRKRAAKPSELGWFEMDDDKNRFVYVENLPLDITLDEFVKEMGKVGMVMHDFDTRQPRARLYKHKNDETKNKGDGIICYLKVESVDLALDFLDGSTIRGYEIKVSRAKFERKEGFDSNKRRKRTNKEKRAIKKHEEKLFRWAPETKLVRPKKDNTVILKNVFDFEIMKDSPDIVFDIKEKMKKALVQIGKFRSLQVHDLHPEGVVQINFNDPNESDVAVSYFDNKLWNGRKISASLWDGKTRYKIKETEEQEKERLAKWDKSLKGAEGVGDCINESGLEEDDGGSETGDEDVDSD